ncbi:hypothetical protein GCM10010532_011470 [Dactylosporangium siamense]|uniref:Uncharacterized protein n=1 Tax=Dactylosporangium siamense TaxID=685454 RepID=A0A919U630_9ACTN|nr:hypothetical protein Dsi01nite_010580 [Dactylosporangium siamense]
MSAVEAFRSRAIVDIAGATRDCSTAKARPPSDRYTTSRVLLTCRLVATGGSMVRVMRIPEAICKRLLT